MTDNIYVIVFVGWMIALLVFYHKVFTVYYFDLGQGLLKEIVGAFIIAMLLTGLTFYLWWLTAIIIIITGVGFKKKTANNAPLVLAIVFAIIVSILGISARSKTDSNEATANVSNIVIQEEIEC